MLLIVLTVAAVLLALCITTDGTADRSNVTVTKTNGDTHEGCINVTGGRVRSGSLEGATPEHPF